MGGQPATIPVARKWLTWPRQRWIGMTIGFGTQILFLYTVWQLLSFLKPGPRVEQESSQIGNLLLSLQFCIVHSWLLFPSTRRWLTQYLASEFYGCLFCVATCLGLLAMFVGWQTSPIIIWNLVGPAAIVLETGFYAAWIGLFYSLALTGLGYQTGWTPFWFWLRRQPIPKRTFEPRGAYLVLRHPVYLSFLGLIWFTPRMTLDHAVLTSAWTMYILIGSYLKDERLAFYYGREYRRYQERVSGYPLIGWGPLGRRQPDSQAESVPIAAMKKTAG